MALYNTVLTEELRVQKIEMKITLSDGQVRQTERELPRFGWDNGYDDVADLLDSLLGNPAKVARWQEDRRQIREGEEQRASDVTEPPENAPTLAPG